jgi:thiol-disulfide isomerase/thioredoxin
MKRIFFAFIVSALLNVCNAQPVRELKIGDTLPSLVVNYLENNEIKTKQLSSFYKSRFLVLDFWATWCAACIKSMSSADSVVDRFNNQIQLLPVTYEDHKTVQQFVLRNKLLNKLNLNYVVGDSLLMGGYFKFSVLPHDVWIDTNGVIKAITYPDEISYDNLVSFINNSKLSIEEKVDDVSFDFFKPFKVEDSLILYRSLLTRYLPGVSNYIGGTIYPEYHEDSKMNRFAAVNKDFLSLFYAAYSYGHGSINFSRVELYVKDSVSLNPFPKNKELPSRKLVQKYCKCYELILPDEVTDTVLYARLFDELNRISNFHASIEKRERPCWVLVNADKNKNPAADTGKPKLKWDQGFMSKMINYPMNILTAYLNWNMELPVVNETGFDRPLNIELKLSADATKDGFVYFNVEKVRNSLNKYGFDIIRSTRPVDILVIRDK